MVLNGTRKYYSISTESPRLLRDFVSDCIEKLSEPLAALRAKEKSELVTVACQLVDRSRIGYSPTLRIVAVNIPTTQPIDTP